MIATGRAECISTNAIFIGVVFLVEYKFINFHLLFINSYTRNLSKETHFQNTNCFENCCLR